MAVLAATLFSTSLQAQNTISGYVYDENQYPYPGANIVLNDSAGSVSDVNGYFAFRNVSNREFTIHVSAIGFQSIKISGLTDTLSSPLAITLQASVQKVGEVKVSGNAGERVKRMESISIQLIEEEFLKESKTSNLMQSLNVIPGVNSMDVGTGISKPMIRGMSYYRVAVAQNGIKQEGQQWSNHHGVSIDQQAVGHVEVLKGPASLQYGSDAIGGVINILPLHVPVSSGFTGELSFTGKTNTQWLGSAGNFSFRKGDIYSNITLSYNSYGDFQIPETESFLLPTPVSSAEASHKVTLGNQMYNTAGNQKAVSISAGLVKPWGNSYIECNYYGTETGFFDWQGIQIDSIKNEHARNRRDLQMPYQQVDNYSIYSFTNRYFGKDKLEVALGYQLNDSKEFGYLSDRTGNRTDELNFYRNQGNKELGLVLHTMTANVFYNLKTYKRHTLKVGVNNQYQQHTTDGYMHILPAYQKMASGAFLMHKFKLNEHWVINSGARFDFTVLNIDESLNPDPAYGDSIFNTQLEKRYPGTAYSLGFNYLPSRKTICKINIGKSYRVPSVYELSAYGLHRHQGRFEKGNPDNKPEQAWQLDLGVEQKWENLQLQISPFVNYFTNYLYLEPTPYLRPEGQEYEYRQTRAMMSGTEASAQYLFRNKVELKLGAEYVYAVNLDLKSALPFTPPFTIQTGISYLFKDAKTFKKSKLGAELITVAEQKYTVPNELNTPGYNAVNLLAKTKLNTNKQAFTVMLKVRNLLNSSYYKHISFYRRLRIPEAGRDVQLFLSIPIANND